MTDYLCPNCNEKQTEIIQWQTISMASKFNLDTKDWETNIKREGGDFESFNCPNCDEELPRDIEKKLLEII